MKPQSESASPDVKQPEKVIAEVQRQSLTVQDASGEEMQISKSEEAFFALLAQDLSQLAHEYKKTVHEIHELFH